MSANLGYKAKNPVDPTTLSAEQLEEVEAFLSAIDGNDDVQNVYVGLAHTDEVLREMGLNAEAIAALRDSGVV